ncbi:MAG TPA: (2Fe-2S)-binding protein [Thermoanaerobaculia bacterium]|jgi:carbon-monoxide dehydrogenase small subunit|nr:(2Fe-2S)-binding protein [Thermoanaerobaculia bacterium]
MATISLTVNERAHVVDVEPRTLLVELLREQLRLTGTHVGCDTSQCGACTVWVDGKSIKSCAMLALEAAGAAVTTIEGLAEPAPPGGSPRLHPMQAAFNACHGLQCGFCTPGMVMSATELVRRNPRPSEDDVRHWLEGNLCRCTGYHNIVRAVIEAAAALGAGAGQGPGASIAGQGPGASVAGQGPGAKIELGQGPGGGAR